MLKYGYGSRCGGTYLYSFRRSRQEDYKWTNLAIKQDLVLNKKGPQGWRDGSVFLEDMASIPGTHMTAHNYL